MKKLLFALTLLTAISLQSYSQCSIETPQVILNRVAANSTEVKVKFTDLGAPRIITATNTATFQSISKSSLTTEVILNLTDGSWLIDYSKSCGLYPYKTPITLTSKTPLSGATMIASQRSVLINQPMPVGYTYLHGHYRVRGSLNWSYASKILTTGVYSFVGLAPNTEYEFKIRAYKDSWGFFQTEWEYLTIKTQP